MEPSALEEAANTPHLAAAAPSSQFSWALRPPPVAAVVVSL